MPLWLGAACAGCLLAVWIAVGVHMLNRGENKDRLEVAHREQRGARPPAQIESGPGPLPSRPRPTGTGSPVLPRSGMPQVGGSPQAALTRQPDAAPTAATRFIEGEPISDADALRNTQLLERLSNCDEPVWSSHLPPDAASLGMASTAASPPGRNSLDSALYDRGTIVEALEFDSWEAEPDAPLRNWEYKTRGLNIRLSAGDRSIYPPHPGRFVLTVSDDRDGGCSWKVYDLSTGERIGAIVKHPGGKAPALFSLSGRYAATWGSEKANGCRVFSFVTGESTCEVSVAAGRPSFLSFVGAHHLLSVEAEGATSIVRVWDVRDGSRVQCFTIPHQQENPSIAESTIVSPGGKYLCRIEGCRWCIYDIVQARCVGHAPLPEPRFAHALRFSHIGSAFSQDGTRLATMLSVNGAERLVITDFQTGEVWVDRPYNQRMQTTGPGSLQWLPDNTGLLYRGQFVLDSGSGEPVWTLPEDRSTPRRMIDCKYLLTEVPSDRGRVITCVELPQKQLEEVWETVRAGGEAVDTLLPALVQVDLSSAPLMSRPSTPPSWTATGDAQTSASFPGSFQLKIAGENEPAKAVVFAAPSTSLVAVCRHGVPPATPAPQQGRTGRAAPRQTSGLAALLQRHNLQTAEKSEEIILPLTYEAIDISPTGQVALVGLRQRTGCYKRLDIVRFAPREHVVGWRPFKQQESEGRELHVTHAVMLDDEHVLTVAENGQLAVWQLPQGVAVYTYQEFGVPLAYSPNRKYMVASHDHRLRVYECRSGKCCGELRVLDTHEVVAYASFRRDGSELLALIQSHRGTRLFAWDMLTGAPRDEYPLPGGFSPAAVRSPGRGLDWLGSRYLLLDRSFLFDLEGRVVIWLYQAVSRDALYPASPPDDALWVATRRSPEEAATYLMPLRLPSAMTRRRAAEKAPAEVELFARGARVRLEVQGFGEFQDEVRQRLTDGLLARGIAVSPDAGLWVTFAAQRGNTGGQIGISRSWSSRAEPEQTFAEEQIMCRLVIRRASGPELWTYERRVTMPSGGLVRTEDAKAELRKAMEDGFRRFATSDEYVRDGLPEHLPLPLEETIAGFSRLEFGREEPAVATERQESSLPPAPLWRDDN